MALRELEEGVRRLQLRAGTADDDRRDLHQQLDRGRAGSTTERNARWGNPAALTTAQRVELANAGVVWFNTDLGWTERYYVPAAGHAGLTAPALVAGTAAGWYPTGRGPYAMLDGAGAAQAGTNGVIHTSYLAFGSGQSWRNVPASIIDRPAATPGRLTVGIAGRWRFAARFGFPTGTGTGVCSLRSFTAAGAAIKIYQIPMPLTANYGNQAMFDLGSSLVPAGGWADFRTDTASWSLMNEWFIAEYLGPALVTA